MIEVNLLLGQVGKAPDSFVLLDLMRLPLGILTGVGFIGGGAILRRQDGVIGITTAASIWFVTVIGLCFGSGEIGLRPGRHRLGHDHPLGAEMARRTPSPASIGQRSSCRTSPAAPEGKLDRALESAGIRISTRSIAFAAEPPETHLEWALRWRSRGKTAEPPGFLADFAKRAEIQSLEWRTQDAGR